MSLDTISGDLIPTICNHISVRDILLLNTISHAFRSILHPFIDDMLLNKTDTYSSLQVQGPLNIQTRVHSIPKLGKLSIRGAKITYDQLIIIVANKCESYGSHAVTLQLIRIDDYMRRRYLYVLDGMVKYCIAMFSNRVITNIEVHGTREYVDINTMLIDITLFVHGTSEVLSLEIRRDIRQLIIDEYSNATTINTRQLFESAGFLQFMVNINKP